MLRAHKLLEHWTYGTVWPNLNMFHIARVNRIREYISLMQLKSVYARNLNKIIGGFNKT